MKFTIQNLEGHHILQISSTDVRQILEVTLEDIKGLRDECNKALGNERACEKYDMPTIPAMKDGQKIYEKHLSIYFNK